MARTIHAVAMTALLLLAGCAGSVPSLGGSGDATQTGRMNFYVSDEKNAISDFEHLNVTVTAVAFKQADASTEAGDATTNTTTNTTTDASANASTPTYSREEIQDKQESSEWVVRDVDDRTVDLTTLQGANATMLADFDVPAGDYETAMVYVSDVNATLKSGEQVDVKLPSEKLHVNKPFTVGDGEAVDFVFDMTVVKKGNGGYNLKPVVAESGTDVEIREVAELDDDDDRGKDHEDEATLNASFVGNVTAGENATLRVTNASGAAVEGASVTVNDEFVGETDASGEVTFQIPADGEDVEIEVEGEHDAELEFEGTVRELATGVFTTSDEDATEGDHSKDTDNAKNEDNAKGNAKNHESTDDDSTTADASSSDSENATVDLAAAFTTDVQAGQNATIVVTDENGTPVEGAIVELNGEVVGETNADGSLTFQVPSDADDVTVVVTKGDAEVELESGVVATAA